MKKLSLLILSVINIIATAICIAMSPFDVVPTHFNLMAEADGYSSKWRCMFFPCIIIIVGIAYLVRCIYAEKRNSQNYDEKIEFKISVSIFTFFLVISWYMNLVAITGVKNISDTVASVFTIVFGLYILYLSNMYGKLKYKSIMGIRTKATLSDSNIWKKAHRLGGYLGVSAGILMIIAGIVFKFIEVNYYFLPIFLIIAILGVVVAEGIPAIYAQVIYKKSIK